MARPREFNKDEALDKAMKVFWQKGYANTSIDDLVSATGVNRYGLYGEFENKHGLFIAALDHYQHAVLGMLFGIVEQPKSSLAEVRLYFAKLVELSSTDLGRFGCLMASSASEVAPLDLLAASKVSAFWMRLQNGFKTALLNAETNGELTGALEPEQIADFLTGVIQGLSVMARSNASHQAMTNVVHVALSKF